MKIANSWADDKKQHYKVVEVCCDRASFAFGFGSNKRVSSFTIYKEGKYIYAEYEDDDGMVQVEIINYCCACGAKTEILNPYFPKDYEITVNGSSKHWDKPTISYEEIGKEFGYRPWSEYSNSTVVYRHGKDSTFGTITPGQSIPVVNGLVIYIANTNNA
jgi:hypothetical protein